MRPLPALSIVVCSAGILLFACGCCTPAAPGSAGSTVTIVSSPMPDDPVDLVRNPDFGTNFAPWETTPGHNGLFRIIHTPDGPCPTAIRATVDADTVPNEWDIMLKQPVDEALEDGEELVLKAWLRSPQNCRASMFVELARDPWTKSPFLIAKLTPDWREYELRGTCSQAYGVGDAQVGFHLAHDTGTIDIAGVHLTAGSVTYGSPSRRATADRPKPLIANGDFRAPIEEHWDTTGGEHLELATRDDDLGYRVLSVTSTPPNGTNPWDICLYQTSLLPVREAETVFVRFRARSAERSRVSVVFEGAYEPYTKILHREFVLTPEWRDYRFAAAVDAMYGRDETHVKFYLGHEHATVELAAVRVENHGTAETDPAE